MLRRSGKGSDSAADAEGQTQRLGDLLVEAGIVSEQQVEEGLARQQEHGSFLGQAMVELGYLTQDTLVNFLVKQCRIPHINLLDYQISEDLIALVPEEVCLEHGLLPIDKLGKILTVAMVDPLDMDALETVRQACPDLKIKPILCEFQHFQQVVAKTFHKEADAPGGEEVSMASLGLKSAAPPPPLEPEPESTDTSAAVDAAVGEVVSQAQTQSQSPPPAPAAAPLGPDFAQVLAASVRDAMQESTAALITQLQGQAAPAPPVQELGDVLRQSIQEAMAQAVAGLQHAAPSGADAPAPPPAAPAPPSFTPEDLAGAIRDAMREATAALAQDVGAQRAAGDGATSSNAGFEAALAAIQEGQAAQQERLAELTQAALDAAKAAQSAVEEARNAHDQQATELLSAAREAQEAASSATEEAKRAADHAETASVDQQNLRDLKRGGPEQRKRRHAAAILGKAESDVLEAMEGPGVSLHIDERILAALECEVPLAGYTFDNFFVGEANGFTLKVSRAVAENPGAQYNPYFLYGGVGLGKTHLINAIGNAILDADENVNVGYVSSSRFARKLKEALEANTLDDFRENFCQWDVLIFDDVHFLGGRIEAQEEFFHIFNALYQEAHQVIIAADKPPDRLGELEQRLVSRFASGIVASLRPPEWETRLQILRHQVTQAKVKVPEDLLSLIAGNVSSDVRKMTGSLRKVLAYADLMEQSITADLVNEILGHLGAGVD